MTLFKLGVLASLIAQPHGDAPDWAKSVISREVAELRQMDNDFAASYHQRMFDRVDRESQGDICQSQPIVKQLHLYDGFLGQGKYLSALQCGMDYISTGEPGESDSSVVLRQAFIQRLKAVSETLSQLGDLSIEQEQMNDGCGIHREMVSRNDIVVPISVGDRCLVGKVDSGANISFTGADLASTVFGLNTTFGVVGNLSIASYPTQNLSLFALPNNVWDNLDKDYIDIYLGSDILSHFVIDGDSQGFTVRQSSGESSSAESFEAHRLAFNDEAVMLPVEVEGVKTYCVIDTGSEYSVIDPNILRNKGELGSVRTMYTPRGTFNVSTRQEVSVVVGSEEIVLKDVSLTDQIDTHKVGGCLLGTSDLMRRGFILDLGSRTLTFK